MRTIGRGTLLAAGALGVALVAAGTGTTAGTFAAAGTGQLDLAAVSSVAYQLVLPDGGTAEVDPATGEPPSRCRTGELRISARADVLDFENITGHACFLRGHPGVSATTGSFTPTGAAVPAILLAPGDHVQAAIHPAGETCGTTVRVPGYLVSAPDDTAAVLVAAPHEACAAGTVGAFAG